jgi:phosphate transport system substrate-binding protein
VRDFGLRGIAVTLSLLLLAVSCGGTTRNGAPTPKASPTESLAGKFNGSGGGAALTAVQALTKKFTELHPAVSFQLDNVGTETSIVLANTGDADFGFISRDLRPEEKDKVVLQAVGSAGTGVIVNPANGLSSITKAQLKQIYQCALTDWSQVGGQPGQIRPFVREANSSTRQTWETYVFGGEKPSYGKCVVEAYESDETQKAVVSFKDSIAMYTLSTDNLKNKNIKFLTLDGVAPTTDALVSLKWPIFRPLYVIYNPEPTKVKPTIKAFIEFIRSPEGQAVLKGL